MAGLDPLEAVRAEFAAMGKCARCNAVALYRLTLPEETIDFCPGCLRGTMLEVIRYPLNEPLLGAYDGIKIVKRATQILGEVVRHEQDDVLLMLLAKWVAGEPTEPKREVE